MADPELEAIRQVGVLVLGPHAVRVELELTYPAMALFRNGSQISPVEMKARLVCRRQSCPSSVDNLLVVAKKRQRRRLKTKSMPGFFL